MTSAAGGLGVDVGRECGHFRLAAGDGQLTCLLCQPDCSVVLRPVT